MCRLLAVRSAAPIDPGYHLERFRALCRSSREYQGHGWGCAWFDDGKWRLYRTVRPIWEDDFRPPGPVRLLLAHARSAFRDQGIAEENNQPFVAGGHAFVFNGELRGVRLRVPGRIGAEKIFNLVRRFAAGGSPAGVRKACRIVQRRSALVRAMNFVLAGDRWLVVHCCFHEAPDYYTLHKLNAGTQLVYCSEPYPDGRLQWRPIANGTIEVFPW